MNKLPVPENIPLRWELWRGFGTPELLRSVVVCLIVTVPLLLFCFANAFSQQSLIVLVLTLMLTIFLCISFFARLDQNRSIYEYLRQTRRFQSEQQRFPYKQTDEVIYFVTEEKA